MNIREELIRRAELMNACSGGFSELSACQDTNQLLDCLFNNIDFCLAKNFPSAKTLRRHFYKEARARHIYIDETVEVINPDTAIFMKSCDAVVRVDGYNVSTIYVKQFSKVHIVVSGNAVVMVDALDDAIVTVENNDAKVVVNLYSKAACTGNAKIINKNLETYDL